VPVGVVRVGGLPVGGDYVRIQFISFAELFLRCGPHAFRFLLLFTGIPAQAFGLHLGLLGVGLSARGLGLAFPRSELIGRRFFAHFGRPVPVRLHLAPAVEEQ
jgi:hypothetical protein